MIIPSILSLLIPAWAAGVVAKRLVGPERNAARVVAWFIVFASLIVLPIQLAAALQLLGIISRIPLALPAAVAVAMAMLVLIRTRGSRTDGGCTTDPGSGDRRAAHRAVIQAAVIVGSGTRSLRLTGAPAFLRRGTGWPTTSLWR